MKNTKKLTISTLLLTTIITATTITFYKTYRDEKTPKIITEFDSNFLNSDNTISKINEILSKTYLDKLSTPIEDNRKLVALTFDDGPGKYTEELLNVLKEYNVTATFFVIGENCTKYPDTLTLIANNNHEIAIHGKTHTSFTNLTQEEVNNEISSTIDYIESLGIDASELVRPPYGSLNSSLKENSNYPFILWNIDTEDWKNKDPDTIKKEILENISQGSIILMHDTTKTVHEADITALNDILPELTKEYNFVTISKLCEEYNLTLENGKTYGKIKSEN